MLFLSLSFLVTIISISRQNSLLSLLWVRESLQTTDKNETAYLLQFRRIKACEQTQHYNCSPYANRENLTSKLDSGDKKYKITLLN